MNPWAIAAIAWLPASIITGLLLGRRLRHQREAAEHHAREQQ